MAVSVVRNFQSNIEASTDTCREGIERWLKDQDLSLSDNKKNKLALLLVRYLSENNMVTQERVMNLLGNLGGGHFDFDDMDSVEIEIQRLLGHTKEKDVERDRIFYHKIALSTLIILMVMTFGVFSITFKPEPGHKGPLASPEQLEEMYTLMDSVMQLRADLGRPVYSRNQAIYILGRPLGIYNPEEITENQYAQMTELLQNFKVELLEQKQAISAQAPNN